MSDRLADTLAKRRRLTGKALRAIGAPTVPVIEVVLVPLLDLPARDDSKDRRR